MGSVDSWLVAFAAWDRLQLSVAASNEWSVRDLGISCVFEGVGGPSRMFAMSGVDSLGGGIRDE